MAIKEDQTCQQTAGHGRMVQGARGREMELNSLSPEANRLVQPGAVWCNLQCLSQPSVRRVVKQTLWILYRIVDGKG